MIIFTQHAKDRMEERGILREEIRKVIENPDYIFRESDGRVIVRKKSGVKEIEIVYIIENSKKIILTCYFL